MVRGTVTTLTLTKSRLFLGLYTACHVYAFLSYHIIVCSLFILVGSQFDPTLRGHSRYIRSPHDGVQQSMWNLSVFVHVVKAEVGMAASTV